jgi:prepilin-type N-terminal cleavage/methylation domain-containing protein
MKKIIPKKCRHGFTLIEMLVVIAIIALLVAISIPIINRSISSARRSQSMANQRQLGQALMMYAANNRRNELPAVVEENVPGLPFGRPWFVAISPYLERQVGGAGDLSAVYRCPVYAIYFRRFKPNHAASDWDQLGYGMNFRLAKLPNGIWPWALDDDVTSTNYRNALSDIPNPSRTVLIADAGSWNFNVYSGNYQTQLNPDSPNTYWSRVTPDKIILNGGFRHGRGALFLMVDGSVHFLTPNQFEPFLN